ALSACGAQRFDKGVAPYQDAQLVIDLRNELVHARAQTASVADKDQVERRRLMRPKFAPNKKAAAGDPYFRDHNLSADCAEWAVRSARALADRFFARTNIKPNYQRVDFSLNDASQAPSNRWWASARRAACWLRSLVRQSKDC